MRRQLFLIISIFGIVSCAQHQQMAVNTDYKTITVKATEQTLHSEYSASIRGKQDVDIYPQVSGTLTSVLVHEGANVKNGELLFIIDQASYKAALEKAKLHL